jgi:hypothetical protein
VVLSVFFRTEDPACLLFFHFGNFLEAGWSSTKLWQVPFWKERMSALPTDMGGALVHVRFVPIADMTVARDWGAN